MFLHTFGDRQRQLLRLLHRHRPGLTIDELAESLGVTRTAVRQHLSALQSDGFITLGGQRRTRGRPSRRYRLTAGGEELFPRRYAWLSRLLLNAMKKEAGSEGLAQRLESIGRQVAEEMAARLEPSEFPNGLGQVADVLTELGFEAEQAGDELVVANCVYHEVATCYPEVCRLDAVVLEQLVGRRAALKTCIVTGDGVCRYTFGSPLSARRKLNV